MKIKTLLLTAVVGCASAKTDTMIVFDASGSMWGQIDGQTKIEIARTAVGEISQGFDTQQVVGLMAYGHRRKGDCGDIETLVAPAAGSAATIAQQIQSIQPKGKTPLSQAVKMAAEQLKFTENRAEVVLITDGIETCDLDPCSVATELETLGIDFKAHVIGFGLSADQGKQVSCMADITGGQYLAADNAAALNEALQQVITEAKTEVVVELPEASVNVITESIVIGGGFAVSWEGPAGEGDYIDVVNTADKRVYGELAYAWVKEGQPAQLNAPGKPGSYDVRYVWQGPDKKHVIARTSVTVKDSEVSLVAPSKVNAGEHFEVQWTGPNRKDDYVDLVKKDYKNTYGELSYFYTKNSTGTGLLQAPATAGDYDIRYALEATDGRKVLHRIPVQVGTVDISLAFKPSAEVAAPFTVYWTGPNNKDGYVDIIKAGSKRTYGEVSYFYLKDNPGSGELMSPVESGDYQVRFIMVGAEGRTVMASSPITIEPVTASLNLPTTATVGSEITVQWQGPNRDKDYIDLIKASRNTTYGETSYFYTKDNPEQGVLQVPDEPGEYKIRYVLQGKTRLVLTEQIITVQ